MSPTVEQSRRDGLSYGTTNSPPIGCDAAPQRVCGRSTPSLPSLPQAVKNVLGAWRRYRAIAILMSAMHSQGPSSGPRPPNESEH
jgi:hypothetical protein